MTPQEAALQMELLGHSFYLFLNAETDRYSVLYRRRGGSLGLIEPQ
jgi:putative sigma-54 modulation protein